MNLRGLLIVAVLLTVLVPARAFSQDQPWLADRKYTVGPGYRVGDFELHPGFAAEFGYDSNFFLLASKGDSQGEPAGAMRLRLTPSFSFSTLGPQRRETTAQTPPPPLEIFGGVSATYNEFFPVNGPEKKQFQLGEQRNISGHADIRFGFNTGHPWSGSIAGSVSRLIQPSQEGVIFQSFNRFVPTGAAEIIWTPNNGMLDWRLGYNFTGVVFESDTFSGLTNFNHTLQMRGRWRFLPRSALLYDARFSIIHYVAQDEDDYKTGSMPIRAQLGYNGLITPNFGALLMVGWGSSFYDPNKAESATNVQDFDSIISQAEIRYFFNVGSGRTVDPAGPSSTSAFALGFTRDFYDAYVGSYFERDRGYLKLTYYVGGKFVVIVDAGAGALVNPSIKRPDFAKSGWTDIRIDAAGFAEYRFRDAFGVNATLRYGTRLSDETLPIKNSSIPDKLQWSQFEAYLGVRWLM
ncbi:MAG TPA: hypothetical protein PK156_38835 [Polyangium sp.]|nr:hypothetical protein [Polyangium sp.]